MDELRVHSAAALFPLLEGKEFEALVADIREHGLHEPIVLHPDGSILDGRNRHRACHAAGVEPRFETWDGDGTPEAYVVSKNIRRRHLTEGQKGLIMAELANLERGNPTLQKPNGSLDPFSRTIDEAAALAGVSAPTIKRAKVVLRDGTPEEIEAVRSGASLAPIAQRILDRSGGKRRTRVMNKKQHQPARNETDSAGEGNGLATPVYLNLAGRRVPLKPTAECMERGLDQLDNTVEALGQFFKRSDADLHTDYSTWIGRLEKTRAVISRLINQGRKVSSHERAEQVHEGKAHESVHGGA